MSYIPLHIYSEYNFLNSAIKIEQLCSTIKEKEIIGLGICDLQKMFAYPTFNSICAKKELKPVFGLSFYVDINSQKSVVSAYITSEEGYINLCHLLFDYPELIPLDKLVNYGKGLILVVPMISNKEINRLIVNSDVENLSKTLFALKNGFDELYIGMECYQNKDLSKNKFIRDFVKIYPYPLVAFNKILYLKKKDALTLNILNAIKNNETIDENDIDTFEGPYFLMSENALKKLYTEEEINNTSKIADCCNFSFNIKRGKLLHYPFNGDKKQFIYDTSLNYLKGHVSSLDKTYLDRLDYELNVIEKMGYLDYFLIVWDYVKFAKTNKISVGPGRGSAAGSLVAYGLNITEVDPIKNNLLFERFLNPKRSSMPDIDIDFSDVLRNNVVDYLATKYGNTHFANIVTFQTIGAKQSLRDIGRVFSFNTLDINELCNSIRIPNISLSDAYHQSPDFHKLVQDSHFLKIVRLAHLIEGFPRQSGLHAAGIILNDSPLYESIPTFVGDNNRLVVEYEMGPLEEQGYLKMDILGLRNLSIIENVIGKINNPDFDLHNIPYDDQDVFSILNKGLTQGLFQLESDGMTKSIKEVKMNCFDDIVAIEALYRPGPMDNISTYAKRKNENLTVDYLTPLIEPILKPTYGVIIYQEQIMQIVQKIANFDLGQADLFRRAISKKDSGKLLSLKQDFINGATSNNISLELSEKVYDLIFKFANYGFNKSHSVSYATITYQMAYLKVHYPAAFFASLLDFQNFSDSKFSKYYKEMRDLKITLILPDINKSSESFIVNNNTLLIPFSAIKGLPFNIVKQIINERSINGEFTSFIDFLERMLNNSTISHPNIITLINSGAFDCFNKSRETLRKSLPILSEYISSSSTSFSLLTKEEKEALQPVIEDYPEDEELKREKEYETLGILLSSSLFDHYKEYIKIHNLSPINECKEKQGDQVFLAMISNIRVITTKKKESMAILQVNDDFDDVSVVVFPNLYNEVRKLLEKKQILCFDGYFKNDSDRGISFIANKIKTAED